MSRRHTGNEMARMARAKRDIALERSELRGESVPRRSAAGPTSAPLKARDPNVDRMVEDFLARRAEGA